MARWLRILPAICIGGCLLTGCTVALKDKGEVLIEFTQGVRIGHSTSETKAESAAVFDPQPLMDWIIEVTGESPQSVEEPGPT